MRPLERIDHFKTFFIVGKQSGDIIKPLIAVFQDFLSFVQGLQESFIILGFLCSAVQQQTAALLEGGFLRAFPVLPGRVQIFIQGFPGIIGSLERVFHFGQDLMIHTVFVLFFSGHIRQLHQQCFLHKIVFIGMKQTALAAVKQRHDLILDLCSGNVKHVEDGCYDSIFQAQTVICKLHAGTGIGAEVGGCPDLLGKSNDFIRRQLYIRRRNSHSSVEAFCQTLEKGSDPPFDAVRCKVIPRRMNNGCHLIEKTGQIIVEPDKKMKAV